MIKDLDLSEFDIDQLKNTVLAQLKSIQFTSLKYIKNGQAFYEYDLTNIVDATSLFEFDKAIKQKDGYSFVYLIAYNNNVKYVGKAIDVKTRLKSHLVKKSDSTNSKISKIHDIVKDQSSCEVQCFAFRIIGKRFYSVVEGIMIDHYDTTTNGWNEKES